MKVTNNGTRAEDFHVTGGKPGEPKWETLDPGETKELDLADRDAPFNRGREAAGTITIGGRKTAAKPDTAATT